MKTASIAETHSFPHRIRVGGLIIGFQEAGAMSSFMASESLHDNWEPLSERLPLNGAGDGHWRPIESFEMRGDLYLIAVHGGHIWSNRLPRP